VSDRVAPVEHSIFFILMIVLKTKSQLDSFMKRTAKKRCYYLDHGCGCCSDGVSMFKDNNRVVLRKTHQYAGQVTSEIEIVAVYKPRRSA
jgi:hypothetical protein